MESFAAERTWFAVAPDGTEHQVILRVGIPVLAPSGEWWAAVSLGALEPPRAQRIAGLDAWQAMHLAMRFVATRVGHFADDGWQFYWERGGERAAPSELLEGSTPLGGNAP